jgi:hypothetical protein
MMGGIKMRKIRQFKIAEHVVLEVVAALGLCLGKLGRPDSHQEMVQAATEPTLKLIIPGFPGLSFSKT